MAKNNEQKVQEETKKKVDRGEDNDDPFQIPTKDCQFELVLLVVTLHLQLRKLWQ